MIDSKKVVCIIPARLASTRFPKKVLALLGGKPMLQWVWEAATKTTFFSDIVFAIDDEETAHVIKGFKGKYLMTSPKCASGTDRLVEIMHTGKIEGDIWVNWQGDEPFITPAMIEELLQSCENDKADVWTLKKRIDKEEQITSPNVAKVVCDVEGYALYFSRSTIPYYRDKDEIERVYYKHIGLYAYTTKALQEISRMRHSYLEEAEKLEQLRFLHHRLAIRVHTTKTEVFGIDTPQDLAKAEEIAQKRK